MLEDNCTRRKEKKIEEKKRKEKKREGKRRKMAGCTIGGYARANFSHRRSSCSERQGTVLTLKQTTVVGAPGETSCTHI